YGNYPLLYEIGRVEAFRSLGLSYKELEQELRIMMPVVSMECRYIKPAFYDENIIIETRISEMPGKMISFDDRILNPREELIHTAVVKLFFISMDENKRVSIPNYLKDKLLPYFD